MPRTSQRQQFRDQCSPFAVCIRHYPLLTTLHEQPVGRVGWASSTEPVRITPEQAATAGPISKLASGCRVSSLCLRIGAAQIGHYAKESYTSTPSTANEVQRMHKRRRTSHWREHRSADGLDACGAKRCYSDLTRIRPLAEGCPAFMGTLRLPTSLNSAEHTASLRCRPDIGALWREPVTGTAR